MSQIREKRAIFAHMKEFVLEKRPVLRSILKEHGTNSLLEYALHYFEKQPHQFFTLRKSHVIDAVTNEAKRLFGESAAQDIADQLTHHYVVNTTDHHGPITSPDHTNSNMVLGLAIQQKQDPHLRNIIVLAGANVALNNPSYPRGLLFHSAKTSVDVVGRVPIIPNSAKPNLVYGFPAYTAERVQRMRESLREQVFTNKMTEFEEKAFTSILESIIEDSGVLKMPYYSEQISLINYKLWKKYFASEPHFPNLYYMEIERIVSELLMKHHLGKETIIDKFIRDEKLVPKIEHYFDGIQGGFSRKEGWGTYLFWVLPHGRKQRMRLKREGNQLVTDDGTWSIALEPQALQKALHTRELIPSLLIDFLVLACYYGITALGGFSQVNYSTEIVAAYTALLETLDTTEDIAAIRSVTTDLLCDDMTVAYLRSQEVLVPATGIDMVLHAHHNPMESIRHNISTVTLEEAIDSMMGNSYQYLVPAEENRNAEFMSIRESDVLNFEGTRDKIVPFAQLGLDEDRHKGE